MRRGIAIGLVLVLVLALAGVAFAAPLSATFSNLKVYLNNKEIGGDIVVFENTTYLPLKAVCSALGLKVEWNATTQALELTTSNFSGTDAVANEFGIVDDLRSDNSKLLLENMKLKSNIKELEERIVELGGEPPAAGGTFHYFDKDVKHLTYYENDTSSSYDYAYDAKVAVLDNVGNEYTNYLKLYLDATFSYNSKTARSSIEFPLQNKYESFEVKLGLTQEYKDTDATYTQVTISTEDKVLYDESVEPGFMPTNLSLDVSGAEKLIIEVDNKDHHKATEIGFFNPYLIVK